MRLSKIFIKFLKPFALAAALLIAMPCAHALTLQEIKANLEVDKYLTCDYNQVKSVKSLNKDLKSFGTLIIIDNQKLLLKQSEPFDNEIIITDKNIVEISDDEENVISAEINPQVFNISNLMLKLCAIDESFEKYFEVEASGQVNNFTLKLTPKDELLAKIFKTITLKGGKRLTDVVIVDNNNDTTTMSFSNYQNDNVALTDSEKQYLN